MIRHLISPVFLAYNVKSFSISRNYRVYLLEKKVSRKRLIIEFRDDRMHHVDEQNGDRRVKSDLRAEHRRKERRHRFGDRDRKNETDQKPDPETQAQADRQKRDRFEPRKRLRFGLVFVE